MVTVEAALEDGMLALVSDGGVEVLGASSDEVVFDGRGEDDDGPGAWLGLSLDMSSEVLDAVVDVVEVAGEVAGGGVAAQEVLLRTHAPVMLEEVSGDTLTTLLPAAGVWRLRIVLVEVGEESAHVRLEVETATEDDTVAPAPAGAAASDEIGLDDLIPGQVEGMRAAQWLGDRIDEWATGPRQRLATSPDPVQAVHRFATGLERTRRSFASIAAFDGIEFDPNRDVEGPVQMYLTDSFQARRGNWALGSKGYARVIDTSTEDPTQRTWTWECFAIDSPHRFLEDDLFDLARRFPPTDALLAVPSSIVIDLVAHDGGTVATLTHRGVPVGWEDHLYDWWQWRLAEHELGRRM